MINRMLRRESTSSASSETNSIFSKLPSTELLKHLLACTRTSQDVDDSSKEQSVVSQNASVNVIQYANGCMEKGIAVINQSEISKATSTLNEDGDAVLLDGFNKEIVDGILLADTTDMLCVESDWCNSFPSGNIETSENSICDSVALCELGKSGTGIERNFVTNENSVCDGVGTSKVLLPAGNVIKTKYLTIAVL